MTGRPSLNLEGQKFGKLLVLERSGSISTDSAWNCLCDCGNFFRVRGSSMKYGHTTSCGCIGKGHRRKMLERGTTLGNWTVLTGPVEHNNKLYYTCYCACGTVREVHSQSLRNGKSLSCGCLPKNNPRKVVMVCGHPDRRQRAKGKCNSCYETNRDVTQFIPTGKTITKHATSEFFTYVLKDNDDTIIYVGKTFTRRRYMEHKKHPTHRLWWDEVKTIEEYEAASLKDNALQEAQLIYKYQPKYNIDGVTR